MTTAPPAGSAPDGALAVSVIIVSRHRAAMLRRCLTAVAQLDYGNFEVVVVADPAGLVVAQDFAVRPVAFDAANISAARNLGIAAAAGAVVAFIDDDAMPEPQWLRHLAAPFADPAVAAAGGFVLGRNGISFQWQGGTVAGDLVPGPLVVPPDRVSLHRARPGLAIEIKGVNCAYRRQVLAALGGFDPALHYYLDETELNLRLARAAPLVAIVPRARVHHAKVASARRRADGLPLSLTDVGASTAISLRRQGATPAAMETAWQALAAEEDRKLSRLLAVRRITGSEAAALRQSLAAGFAEGRARVLPILAPIADGAPQKFRKFPQLACDRVILSGRPWQAHRLRAAARDLAARGAIVRLFLFSPTAHFHRIGFCDDGYWVQRGGLFGKSLRTDRLFTFWRFRTRLAREAALWPLT